MQAIDQKVESAGTARKIMFLLLSVTIAILGLLFLDVTVSTVAYSIAFVAVLFAIFFTMQRGKPAYGLATRPGTYTRDILVSAIVMAIIAAAIFLLRSSQPEFLELLTNSVWPILGPIFFILFVAIYTISAKGRK